MLPVFIIFVILALLIGLLSFLSCKKYADAHKDQGISQEFINGFRLRAAAGILAEFLLIILAILVKGQ